jgi:hypothetical protein
MLYHYAEFLYAHCHVLIIIMPNVIMLDVVMLSDVALLSWASKVL